MQLTITNVRRIAAAVAVGSTIGTFVTIGPFSVAMYQAGDGQVAAGIAAATFGATFLRRFTTPAVLACALALLGIDGYMLHEVTSVDPTLFGSAMPGWGLIAQTLAAVTIIGQPLVLAVRARRAQPETA